MKVILTALLGAIGLAAAIALPGFILMLVLGAIAAEFGAPTDIGFWPALGLFWGLKVILNAWFTSSPSTTINDLRQ